MEKLWKVVLVVFAFCVAGSYLLLMVLTAIFTDMNAAAEFILLVLPFILTAVIVCHWRTMEKLRELEEKLQRLMAQEHGENE